MASTKVGGNTFQVLLADGSVRALSIKTPEKTLKAEFTRNSGELFDFDKKDKWVRGSKGERGLTSTLAEVTCAGNGRVRSAGGPGE